MTVQVIKKIAKQFDDAEKYLLIAVLVQYVPDLCIKSHIQPFKFK